MTKIIVKKFDPEMIILFGSQATGKAREDSDIDLLVVMDFEGSKRDLTVDIKVAIHPVSRAKDVIVTTPSKYEKRRDIPGTIQRIAYKEGRTLYARSK
ncbi:MAG: nucleotidyltransferase domain-containing protein [Planctomycetes bacterium]|nr:nucleotidyltransferase domain-containing protein [Planctomycetota bacterium]